MKKEIARELTPWANKSNDKYFIIYVESRLDSLRRLLEVTKEIEEIYKIQGQIKEVKRLLTLKDEVKAALDNRGT